MTRVISDRQPHHMLLPSEVEIPSDDCYIESNHIRNIMMLLRSVRNTNGTHGASNTAGTTLYIKSVRRLYLTPLVTLSPEWGIPSCSTMRMRSGMGSTSIKHAPREYGDKRPIHVQLGLEEAGHDTRYIRYTRWGYGCVNGGAGTDLLPPQTFHGRMAAC